MVIREREKKRKRDGREKKETIFFKIIWLCSLYYYYYFYRNVAYIIWLSFYVKIKIEMLSVLLRVSKINKIIFKDVKYIYIYIHIFLTSSDVNYHQIYSKFEILFIFLVFFPPQSRIKETSHHSLSKQVLP